MARAAKVWWRESHQCYYTTIGGRQIRLDPDKKTADRRFHTLMIGAADGRQRQRLRVVELSDLWLEGMKATVKPGTLHTRTLNAQRWCRVLGRHQADDLRPYHVAAYLDGNPNWAASTRSLAIQMIRACFRWGVAQGYLDRTPLDLLRAPKIARRPPLTEGDLAAWLAACDEPAVREFCEFSLETGCRPGEATTLEARSVAWEARHATVSGKTGDRTVPLSEAALRLLGVLRDRHPSGPLLRGPRDQVWNKVTLNWHFREVSERAGIKVVPYQLRGVFATRSLRVNGEIATARLLGHRSLRMLADHYEGLTQDDLRDAVDRVSRRAR